MQQSPEYNIPSRQRKIKMLTRDLGRHESQENVIETDWNIDFDYNLFLFRSYAYTLKKVARISIFTDNCWKNGIFLIYLISCIFSNWKLVVIPQNIHTNCSNSL